MLTADHMSSSLKLLIVQTMDATTNTGVGMEDLLGWNKVAKTQLKKSDSIESTSTMSVVFDQSRLELKMETQAVKMEDESKLKHGSKVSDKMTVTSSHEPINQSALLSSTPENDLSADFFDSSRTVYNLLVSYLTQEPAVRVIAAIRQLLRKANFYEACSNIQVQNATYWDR